LPLYDSGKAVGRQDGSEQEFLYYVMPFVDDESLQDRLGREKQLPIEDALRIAKETASALDYAHRRGVIHRDIKPGNIMLQEGRAIVTDFGIALAVSAAGGDRITETGLSLGTPHYMSPEQATGDREIDARSDVYSLGAVLYEMLAGDPPHNGSTAQAIIAKVVTEDARPVSDLRNTVPPHVDAAVSKALGRLPADRFATAGQFIEALERPGAATEVRRAAGARDRTGVGKWLGIAVAAWAIVATIVAVFGLVGRSGHGEVSRWAMGLPPDHELGGMFSGISLVISPSGEHLAFVAQHAGFSRIYIKALNEADAGPVPGTEGADNPFFSPDGQWLGFFSGNRLQKVPVGGGTPLVLADVPSLSTGATWGVNDTIVFATYDGTLWRVPASGGTPAPFPGLEGATGYFMPRLLPDGSALVTTVAVAQQPRVAVYAFDTGEWSILEELGSTVGAEVVETGHLVFSQASVLWAVPFDVDRLVPVGDPFPLRDSVAAQSASAAQFSVSRNGTLVYAPARTASTLVWVDRDGNATPISTDREYYQRPRLSPDGSQAAVIISELGRLPIWVYDTERGTRSLLVPGMNTDPLWTPSGSHPVFTHQLEPGEWDLVWMPADGSGPIEPLVVGEGSQAAHAVSPDGRLVAFYYLVPGTLRDIWILPLGGEPFAFLATPFNERSPMFSPDSRWLVFVSDESGRDEVYVQAYPGPGGKQQVSTDGGTAPIWSRDGREMFFREGDRVMVADVQLGADLVVSTPRMLFRGPYEIEPGPSGSLGYDVTPDGQRFLMIRSEPPRQINVVLNWFEELQGNN
jgi:serine/threonine-protein kinase